MIGLIVSIVIALIALTVLPLALGIFVTFALAVRLAWRKLCRHYLYPGEY